MQMKGPARQKKKRSKTKNPVGLKNKTKEETDAKQ